MSSPLRRSMLLLRIHAPVTKEIATLAMMPLALASAGELVADAAAARADTRWRRCSNGTMTMYTNAVLAFNAVQRLEDTSVHGAIVEAGVYRGGMSCYMALAQRSIKLRPMWLFDTFEGMPAPTVEDDTRTHEAFRRATDGGAKWCYGSLDTVRHVVEQQAAVPADIVSYVKGKVEETLYNQSTRLPHRIALLRLDTDFYTSTKAELEVLWPLLSPGGWLYIDDYAAWGGARRAVDEWLAARNWTAHARKVSAYPKGKRAFNLWKANPYSDELPFQI